MPGHDVETGSRRETPGADILATRLSDMSTLEED